MAKAWMPFYVGDYLADTTHLTTLQHGAYMLLIMHYWQHGPLPYDDAQLRRITRLDDQQWRRSKETLLGFFREGTWPADFLHAAKANAEQMPSKCWLHKRLEIEREKSEIIRTKRQLAGQIGGRASRGQSNGFRLGSEAIAKQTGHQSQSHINTSYSELGATPLVRQAGKFGSEWSSPTNDDLRQYYKPQKEAAE